MQLISKASLQIQKPIALVYEGIVNPEIMTQYFISESTGLMETGKDLVWRFPEFDDKFTVTEVKVETNVSVSFVWDTETVVTINLKQHQEDSTIVEVTEGNKEYSDINLQWLISNTGGWANFLACMKAYLEYGIHLRRGAYDFMKPVS